MHKTTIAAIATPLGNGSMGVIRISGDQAISIADKVFVSVSGKKLNEIKGYTALFGNCLDGDSIIDQTVATVFRAPKSYTGENVVELSVHGGNFVLKKVLRTLFDNGAVPAAAGEFSRRAFINGKLDLTQAESIMGLISAQSDAQLKICESALQGKTAQEIEKIRADIVSLCAHIAVFSDYPDEELPELSTDNFRNMLTNIISGLENILKNYDAGRILREGIVTAIVGKPNVGKSTLMNLLSGTNRSIVTDVAGTTRDVIEETVTLGDITLRLADTAGIHSTDDTVEMVGVDLAKQRIETSELILAVFDAAGTPDDNDKALLESIKNKKAIVIINKNDIGKDFSLDGIDNFPTVYISAKTGQGYNELKVAVEQVTAVANLQNSTAILTSERQRSHAQNALNGAKEAFVALQSGISIDAVGVCLDDAALSLLSLIGKRVTNEVADEVFRNFCVGK